MKLPIKKNNNRPQKGFILVELIVVLVVIVLLLALLIPFVIHYVDDAKESAELAEVRAARLAMQTLIDEDYIDNNIEEFIVFVDFDNYALSKEGKKKVETLLSMDIGNANNIVINDKNVLKEFSYYTVKGSKINYKNGEYSVEYVY